MGDELSLVIKEFHGFQILFKNLDGKMMSLEVDRHERIESLLIKICEKLGGRKKPPVLFEGSNEQSMFPSTNSTTSIADFPGQRELVNSDQHTACTAEQSQFHYKPNRRCTSRSCLLRNYQAV